MKIDSPDSIALGDDAAAKTAAYIHIPFCRKICPYCDFAVVAGTDLADRYVAALLAEIDRTDPFDQPLASVAFGGGTPTALGADALRSVLEAVEDRFGFGAEVEVSLEANPEDISPTTARSLRAAGFGRISLGVQSFDDSVLASLGRAHSAAEAIDATGVARDVFDSVSVDLMFGTPGEDLESWRSSVTKALELDVDHLSTYSLTVERGTPLSRAVAAGTPAPDPDLQADEWMIATEMAQNAGLVRYETSNYARPGHAVIYNLITWGQGEYAAFGNGAHGHREGLRSWNVRRVDRYIERIEDDLSPVSGDERLGLWEREVERVLLGLRRAAGVVAGEAGERLLQSERGSAVVAAGILEASGERLRIARPLLGDEVSRALLALTPGDC
jgi:putative oxygen-independent coproporphyrinogen III oxidase